MDVKDIIRERRLELGLTYEQLGDIIGVGKSTVRKWETGMIENMKRDSIVALAKALDISPSVIMGWNIEEYEKSKEAELTIDENQLLTYYRQLNDSGKKEANKRVSELTEINKYMKLINVAKEYPKNLEEIYTTVAAHDDDLTEAEKLEADKKIIETLKKRQK